MVYAWREPISLYCVKIGNLSKAEGTSFVAPYQAKHIPANELRSNTRKGLNIMSIHSSIALVQPRISPTLLVLHLTYSCSWMP